MPVRGFSRLALAFEDMRLPPPFFSSVSFMFSLPELAHFVARLKPSLIPFPRLQAVQLWVQWCDERAGMQTGDATPAHRCNPVSRKDVLRTVALSRHRARL